MKRIRLEIVNDFLWFITRTFAPPNKWKTKEINQARLKRRWAMDEKERSMREFGGYLAKLRTKKNVSVRDVAKATGMSDPYLYQVESGKKLLTNPEWFNRLADYFEVPVAELLKKAGYLPEPEEERRINQIWEKVIADPAFSFGTRFSGKLNIEEMKAIIRLYEEKKGKKLL